MKFIKRIFFAILLLVLIGILFRGWIYRNLITYRSLGQRASYTATDTKLIAYIEKNAGDKKNPGIQDIIKIALSVTSQQLNFTTANNDNDPNKLIYSKTAHCIGYANFFSASCNYLLNKYKLDESWKATPQTGQLFLLGENIHNYFSSPFFKDHDFVIIENKLTGEMLAVDPAVNDYFYVDLVTYHK